MDNTFLPSVNYPGYLVNELGVVMHERLERPIVPRLNNWGVLTVKLRHPFGKGFTNTPVARMVAEAFVEKHKPYGPAGRLPDIVIHKNLDREDCRAQNLEWRYRSYGIQYHRLATTPGAYNPFYQGHESEIRDVPIQETTYGSWSSDGPRDFAKLYGILPAAIFVSATINTPGVSSTTGSILDLPEMQYSFWLMKQHGEGLHFVIVK
jgi:hypothetical protein